jgi:hypothetical protein
MENTDVKKAIFFALDEILAIDGILRLDPDSIYNPKYRRKATNDAFISTCEKYNISYNKYDLLPEIKLNVLETKESIIRTVMDELSDQLKNRRIDMLKINLEQLELIFRNKIKL